MKLWAIAILTLITATAAAATANDVFPIKDTDGKVFALVATCSSCKSDQGAKKKCHTGVEEGWLAGQPCGACMIKENFGARFRYPYDLHITGTLTDADGQPVKDRFVKMFMANGWNVRSRTADDGKFRLIMGATEERKSRKPLVTDIGTLVDSKKGNEANYALFFLPESYKPCPAALAPRKRHKKK